MNLIITLKDRLLGKEFQHDTTIATAVRVHDEEKEKEKDITPRSTYPPQVRRLLCQREALEADTTAL